MSFGAAPQLIRREPSLPDYRRVFSSTGRPEDLERSKAARREVEGRRSVMLSKRRVAERQRLRAGMQQERRFNQTEKTAKRRQQLEETALGFATSPFTVDMLADNERVDEEIRVRIQYEEELMKAEQMRKQRVMEEVIRKSLTEHDDIAQLRREKIRLLQEERRLRSLAEAEKSAANASRSGEKWAGRAEENEQRNAIEKAKRERKKQEMWALAEARAETLRVKHGIERPDRPNWNASAWHPRLR